MFDSKETQRPPKQTIQLSHTISLELLFGNLMNFSQIFALTLALFQSLLSPEKRNVAKCYTPVCQLDIIHLADLNFYLAENSFILSRGKDVVSGSYVASKIYPVFSPNMLYLTIPLTNQHT